MNTTRSLTFVMGLFVCASATAKDFRVGDGVVALDIAESWQQADPPRGSGAVLFLQAKAPQRVQVLVTPVASGKTDAEIRQLVEGRALSLGPLSVERTAFTILFDPGSEKEASAALAAIGTLGVRAPR